MVIKIPKRGYGGRVIIRTYLITGGAGFIGSNYARRLASRGESVVILDNLSRPGSRNNIEWLTRELSPGGFRFIEGDVARESVVQEAVSGVDVVVHLAAQASIPASWADPRTDFLTNALGTLNVLEAARLSPKEPAVLHASTSKVYGDLSELLVVEGPTRHTLASLPGGVPEGFPVEFVSPLACSKGAADQYVRDYHKSFGLSTVVFRLSSVYGPRQIGGEPQGWLSWFTIAAQTGRTITIQGDGKQVRDLLYVDDLLDLFDHTVQNLDRAAGRVYNVGGGPDNTLSVWAEAGPILEDLAGHPIRAAWAPRRSGDPRVYVSDISRTNSNLGWEPRVGVNMGLALLWAWVENNPELFPPAKGA